MNINIIKKWTLRVIIAISLAAIAVFILGFGLFAYAIYGFMQCNTAIYDTIPSPSGRISAVVFGRECNATVGFNTRVSIAPTGTPFSPDETPPFFMASGKRDMEIRWHGDTLIEIAIKHDPEYEYHRPLKIYKGDRTVGPITVRYRGLDSHLPDP